MTTLAEQAQAVLDHLERVGWIGGDSCDPGTSAAGNQCLYVGIRNSVLNYHALAEEIRNRIGNHWIVTWNDAPGRTWDDVRSLLRDIIESGK